MKFLGTIGLVVFGFWTFAQPGIVVQLPEKVCKNETFLAGNNSTGATQYLWEFADGGLQTVPTASNLGATAAANAPDGLTLHAEGGNYIGFVVNVNSNNLIRLDFGGSLTNIPTRTDLGNPGSLLSRPRSIAIILYNNNWHGLITNFNPSLGTASVVRLDFGGTLLNTPTAVDLGAFSGRLNQPQTIQWVTDQGELIALIGDRSQRKILMINFGQDPTTTAFSTNSFKEISFPGSGFFRDFSIVRGTDRWYGLAVFENGGIHKMNFTPTLFDVPQVIQLTADLPTFTLPYNVQFLRDVDRFVAVVSEYGGIIISLDFSKNPASNLPTYRSFGNLSSLSNLQGLKFYKTSTGWIGFTHNIATSWLYRISFTGVSDSSLPISTQVQPSLSYTTSGIKYVSLQATDAIGESRVVIDTVLVKMDPQADFSFSFNCTGQNTLFQDKSIAQGTLTWAWDFNDLASGATTSTVQHPVHEFTTATNYAVELTVMDDCGYTDQSTHVVSVNNTAGITLGIVADAQICSHQEKIYSLTSNTTPVENVVWNFGNGETVTAETPTYTYTQDGNFTITVDAIINQCMKQAMQSVEVKRGAEVLFNYSSQCEQTPIRFTEQVIDDDIVQFEWTFPSEISVDPNLEYTFLDTGPVDVTLYVENSLGCETMLTKQINIYSQPQVNFTALAPPFSCSGTPTQLNDLTPPPPDSNLTSWSWDFGDMGSPSNTSAQRNPQHTYATAAEYTVGLTVTTNFSCSKTLQKAVTIYQTPAAAFNHSALCEDSGITFSDAASTNQAWNWQIGPSFYFTENALHTFNNPGEYEILFSVTGVNSCVGSTTQTITIPDKLTVDFSTLRTCVDQQTEFTDLTNDTSDPIIDVHWDFGGLGASSLTPAIFSFPVTGAINVTLTVTTQSGCTYPITKPIQIAQGPLAAFTAIPNIGEAPLTVQFSNTSLNANTYTWKFNSNGSSGTIPSPGFTYVDAGNHTAELIATDLSGCVDTTHQLIEVLETTALNLPSPNPSTGVFTIEWKTNEATQTTLMVVDALGRQIRNFEIMSTAGINRYTLDITGEQSGMYILNIRYSNAVKTYRLMVSE